MLRPTECEPYLQPDKARPFSQRHALQQASILGHAQQAGLLQVSLLAPWAARHRMRMAML